MQIPEYLQHAVSRAKAHIIKDNKKHVGPNFSLRPIADCPNCSECSRACYDQKAYRMYPIVRQARTDNSLLARYDLPRLFNSLSEYLDSERPASFRMHVGGDYISQQYLDTIKRVAADFANVQFLSFTKSYWLDWERPSNFEVVFSIWPSMPIPERAKDIRFAWFDDNSGELPIPSNALYCKGNCKDCKVCWNLSAIGRDVVFQEH